MQLELVFERPPLHASQVDYLVDMFRSELRALEGRSPRSHAPGIRSACVHIRSVLLLEFGLGVGA